MIKTAITLKITCDDGTGLGKLLTNMRVCDVVCYAVSLRIVWILYKYFEVVYEQSIF
jgi:hypothetical protein